MLNGLIGMYTTESESTDDQGGVWGYDQVVLSSCRAGLLRGATIKLTCCGGTRCSKQGPENVQGLEAPHS